MSFEQKSVTSRWGDVNSALQAILARQGLSFQENLSTGDFGSDAICRAGTREGVSVIVKLESAERTSEK